MVELIDVTKTYGAPGGAGTVGVLKGITLKVESGRSMVIVGPSGCGKSTLLNIIGGLDRPTSGRVLLDGGNLADRSDDELARIRNRHIGFVFQLHHLLPQCTVLENVLIPTLAERGGRSPRETHARAKDLLARVGLADRLSYRPGELSGGQRQRVAVARALINRPQLLLADEPTGSLDEGTSRSIAELLVELNKDQGVTLIVATHARELAGRIGQVMELSGGVLSDRGRP
ncbi:MAG: ABC transporter ATP-binding protein [Planctomycetes bacterium]|jgi:ABC-type lipoprotein export system ATPase subunit|nr:ABC transporter ATP-binding protein [Planctomycetota bacterium]